jgi:type IV pilus assembly protein PilW
MLNMRQAGLTIVELMISIAIGMIVVLAGVALLLSARTNYLFQDESARIQDTGRYGLELIARAIRQVALQERNANGAAAVRRDDARPGIRGFDASSLKSQSEGMTQRSGDSVNGSDILVVGFSGSGNGAHGDGTVVNCAGFGVPAEQSPGSAENHRGWSIFHVAKDAAGEPELHCKYRGDNGWTSQAVARGVESFQVIYGLDLDDDGLPNRYVRAAEIDALDAREAGAAAGARDEAVQETHDGAGNPHSYWGKVVVARVAILVRASRNSQDAAMPAEIDLFGKAYADAYADKDQGTRIKTQSLPRAIRNRVRQVFGATIQLRNPAGGGAA